MMWSIYMVASHCCVYCTLVLYVFFILWQMNSLSMPLITTAQTSTAPFRLYRDVFGKRAVSTLMQLIITWVNFSQSA